MPHKKRKNLKPSLLKSIKQNLIQSQYLFLLDISKSFQLNKQEESFLMTKIMSYYWRGKFSSKNLYSFPLLPPKTNTTAKNYEEIEAIIINREAFHRIFSNDKKIGKKLKKFNANLITDKFEIIDDNDQAYECYASQFDWYFYKRQINRARRDCIEYFRSPSQPFDPCKITKDKNKKFYTNMAHFPF